MGAGVRTLCQGRKRRAVPQLLLYGYHRAENAEQYKIELLDKMPSGAALYEYNGKDLKVVHINKRYWDLVGREAIDYSKVSPVSAIHPDDRTLVVQEIESAVRNHREAAVDCRLLYGDASYRPFHITAKTEPKKDGEYLLYVSYAPISDESMSIQEMLLIALSAMVSSSDDMSYFKDKDLRYICVSQSIADMTGCQNSRDFIGKTAQEIFSETFADKFSEDDRHVIETDETVMNALEHLPRADGGICLARTSKFPILDAHGRAIGVYSISRDITAQREKESQLELLTSAIPGGIAIFRCMPGNIETICINDGVCALTGYSQEEIDAQAITMLDLVLDEDRPVVHEQIKRLMASETELDFTVRIHANDRMKWINIVARTTGNAGDIYTANAMLTDVTQQQDEKESLRLANEEYSIAILHSSRTICRYNIATQTLTISTDTAKRLGLPEQMSGVPYERVKLGKISEETKDAYIAFFEGFMGGKKESTASYCKLLPIGWRWIEANATTVFDAEGKPFSAIISYIDVTEQREKETIHSRWQYPIAERPENSYFLLRCNLSRNKTFDSREGKLLDIDFSVYANSLDERTEAYIGKCVYADDRERFRAFMRADTMLAEYYCGHSRYRGISHV